jgi:hypothetical protein
MGMYISTPLWKAVWKRHRKLEIELPYNPVIPFLGMYSKEFKSGYNADTCTPMFIAALFTIASYRNSPDALHLMNGLRKCDTYTQ